MTTVHCKNPSGYCYASTGKANISAMQDRTAGIVVIGNEILTGKSVDKNANFLIKELYRLGVALRRIDVIPDDVEEIANSVSASSSKFDFVFTSGGVGPTHDDMTIIGVARAFDRKVVRDGELARILAGYFGDETDEARLRMADVPEGSTLLWDNGLRWPVLSIENVYVLPGVPEHFRNKFEAIKDRFRVAPFHISMIYTNEDEFDITPRLNEVAIKCGDVEIGSYPTFKESDGYRVKITIESKEADQVERARDMLLGLLDKNFLVRVE